MSDPRLPDLRTGRERPDWDSYFMLLAIATRERAECLGRHVGAVVVQGDRIVASGYNGTPSGFPGCNASERGCHRCADREAYVAGSAYDVCICVHAEQNALLQAARLGIALEGAACFTTLRPCFGCLKELRQAGVVRIAYLNEWAPSGEAAQHAYARLLADLARVGVAVDHVAVSPSLRDLR